MRPDVLVHRVASVAEARALESVGVMRIGVSVVDDSRLADGRGVSWELAEDILGALRIASPVVECAPTETWELPASMMNGAAVIWSPDLATPRTLNRAFAEPRPVIAGPVNVVGFGDLMLGMPVGGDLVWEYQLHGGQDGAFEAATSFDLGVIAEIRRLTDQRHIFVGANMTLSNVGSVRSAFGPLGHMLTLGTPRQPPAGRHHTGVGATFDLLAALGFPALPGAELSPLERDETSRYRARRVVVIAGEAHLAGKQPFDLDSFSALYDLSADSSARLSDDDRRALWAERYYVHSPDVMTLAAFAEHRRRLEPYL